MTASAQARGSESCFVVASTSALDNVANGAMLSSPSMITTSRNVPWATRACRTRPKFMTAGQLAQRLRPDGERGSHGRILGIHDLGLVILTRLSCLGWRGNRRPVECFVGM